MAIEKVEIQGIWKGAANIIWENIDSQVNIIVGNNGSGKSTLLNILYYILVKDTKSLKELITDAHIKPEIEGSLPVCYINTFDIPSSKKSAQSQLTQQLDSLLYQRQKNIYSFTDYRLETQGGKPVENDHVEELFGIINSMFSTSGKIIRIDSKDVVFDKNGHILTIEQLSSGEKQLLILLFSVFLMKHQKSVLLLDEPEISLHMAWQEKLIENLLKLNPNCQLFLTTHSPNIFADGWGDKLVFMENILKEK